MASSSRSLGLRAALALPFIASAVNAAYSIDSVGMSYPALSPASRLGRIGAQEPVHQVPSGPDLGGTSADYLCLSLPTDDIKTSAAQLAYDTMTYYKGNLSGQTPGILPGPPPAGDYYWWEAGALWGAMIEYWHYTGDTTYNDVVTDALLFQVGPNRDYMPPNVTASLGNDDQVRHRHLQPRPVSPSIRLHTNTSARASGA